MTKAQSPRTEESTRSTAPNPQGSPGTTTHATTKSAEPGDEPHGADDGEAAEQYPGGIEPARPGEDDDGEFSLDEIDDDTSLTSSVQRHAFRNGHRYHKFRHGRYPIPNDEREQNREDMLHAMMLEATNGQYFFAPIIENPSKILDLGTGTGIWAMEGGSYPNSYGTPGT